MLSKLPDTCQCCGLLDVLHKQVCILDLEGNILSVNNIWQSFDTLHGEPAPIAIGQNYLNLVDTQQTACKGTGEFIDGIRRVLRNELDNFSYEYLCPVNSNNTWCKATVFSLNNKIIITHEDITEYKLVEDRFRMVLEASPTAIIITDKNGIIVMVNRQTENYFGYSREELINSPIEILIPTRFKHNHVHYRQNYTEDPHARSMGVGKELYAIRKDGTEFPVEVGLSYITVNENLNVISSIIDITTRKQVENKLAFMANHDSLTELYNREYFYLQASKIIDHANRNDNKIAMMFIDLDRFKLINDTLGHPIGDLVLKAVAKRLMHSIRSNDILARVSGDEFAILLSDITNIDDISRVAIKTIEMLTQSINIEGNDIVVTASIGISVYPDDGKDSQTLLTNADIAMYLAKEKGKNGFEYYTAEMTARSIERMTIERALRKALINNEFRLEYQPQTNSNTGKIIGVETLLRWEHPEWGLVYPDRFITIAEETGLIVPIGRWVLKNACLEAKQWQKNLNSKLRLSVNISARQFIDLNLLDSIKEILTETEYDPTLLELEITESAVMQKPERALKVLHGLHDYGINISIDDFGTGYSSLNYLLKFPICCLKIDKTFINMLPFDANSVTMATAIIALSHKLQLVVVAEGVENAEQLKFLTDNGCDVIQGNLFSNAINANDLSILVDK